MTTQLSHSVLAAFFVAASSAIMPLLDKTMRLDLIDLYEAGMPAKCTNRYGGTTTMTTLSDSLVSLQLTNVSEMEFRLTRDSMVEVRHTYKLADTTMVDVKKYPLVRQ